MTRKDMPSALEIHLLGEFGILVDGRRIEARAFTRRKPKQLIKLLALQPQHQLLREQAMEMLWPESNPEGAINNLNKAIHMARHALEPQLRSGAESHFILTHAQQIVLAAPGKLRIDIEEFEQQANVAIKATDASLCKTAIDLFRGDLLGEDLYEDWAATRREQARELYNGLLRRLAKIYESQSAYRESIEPLKKLISFDTADEEAHRSLMRLYALAGNRHLALRQYQQCVEALRKELNVEPEPATVELHHQIEAGRLRAPATADRDVPEVIESIAILPLINAGADPEMEYLSDGLSENIINNLSQLPALRVMAWGTVARFKGRNLAPDEVGRSIAVRAVLTGRVLQVGERLIVRAELIDSVDGAQLWGAQYDRSLGDIFTLQEEIAQDISDKLQLRLSGAERARLRLRQTHNADAYRLYLKGCYHWNKRTLAGMNRSIEYFQEALALDPDYALAYVGLADAYTKLGDVGVMGMKPRAAFVNAKLAAVRALELDNQLAEAHATLGHLNMHDYQWSEAEREFHRAIALSPNYATTHHWYAYLLLMTGRTAEALRSITRALALDPLSLPINTDYGELLYFARRYAEAAEQFAKTLELDSHYFQARVNLARVYEQQGRYSEALAEFRRTQALAADNPDVLSSLAHAFAVMGRRAEALVALEQLEVLARSRYVSPYDIAVVHAGLGAHDDALTLLEQAYEENAEWVIYVTLDPRLDQLRAEPCFLELVRRVGLAPLASSETALADSNKGINSLAILPLVNAGADPNVEYLTDGITENIINNLSQLPGLRVMAWSTVLRFKDSKLDLQTIGRDLGVQAVLTGRVLQLPTRLVVKAELVNVADGSQCWGQRYDLKLSDVFAIEEEISTEISDKLRLTLSSDQQTRLSRRHTESIEAYHAYLKGRYYWNKRTEKDVKRGLEYFNQAIERDPCYALAYAGLADSYLILASFGVAALPPREGFPRARAAAAKGLEIDDTLAEAHASLIAMAQYDWDWPNALKEFNRAIQLQPHYAMAHHWYAFVYLTAMGRLDEAIAEEQRAHELEPLSLIIGTNLGTLLYLARQYDRAIDQYQKVLEIDPDFIIAHWMLALAYEQKRMYTEALSELRTAVALSARNSIALALLGHVLAQSGSKGEAQEILAELNEVRKRTYVSSYRVAAIYEELDEREQAFEWLQRAYDERDPWLIWLKLDPVLDNLRSDARFEELTRRVGLPPVG